uniref:Uncharacterized protein n=1 Tax=Plectus sambesii TaxID=2011161 RepID=A0A914WG02_9BILA
MVASVKAEAEKRVVKERRARRALEREVTKLREYCLQQECELQMYRLMLQQNNIPQPTVLRPPAAPRTLNVIAEVNETVDYDSDAAPPEYSETPPGPDHLIFAAVQHSPQLHPTAAVAEVPDLPPSV